MEKRKQLSSVVIIGINFCCRCFLMVDVLFIEADSSRAAYQDLATDMSAIETPTWSLLLASSCRAKGYTPAIIDQRAERLSDTDLLLKVEDYNPGDRKSV